jgi:hypothetical protein
MHEPVSKFVMSPLNPWRAVDHGDERREKGAGLVINSISGETILPIDGKLRFPRRHAISLLDHR